ncbi:MAG TPA: ABC transporter substrate-binding protein [Stellaceae bacterium]|nr:ABC transporter substrate-binding protein [Stellaceae bacterium]
MKRREFITLLGGATLGWPLAARAQQADKVYRIGYLSLGSPAAEATRFDAFRAGLAALGYVEGKNLVIETRWLEGGKYEQLAELAAQLVDLKVDVIITYATPGVSAAKRATKTIPIVFTTVGDAVAVGLVSSLARPGGNVTGNSYFLPELVAKRLELLKGAISGLVQAGVLFNPANPSTEPVLSALGLTAQSLKLELSQFPVREAIELEGAFAAMAAKSVGAFVIAEDPMLIYNTEASAKLALKYRLAACGFPEFAQAGGFMAYGIDFLDMWRRAATFVDKILKGAKPADLPVEQATKFVTIVNLKTAKAIGVEVTTSLLLRADQVIE